MAEILGSKMEIPIDTLEEERVLWENPDPTVAFSGGDTGVTIGNIDWSKYSLKIEYSLTAGSARSFYTIFAAGNGSTLPAAFTISYTSTNPSSQRTKSYARRLRGDSYYFNIPYAWEHCYDEVSETADDKCIPIKISKIIIKR